MNNEYLNAGNWVSEKKNRSKKFGYAENRLKHLVKQMLKFIS